MQVLNALIILRAKHFTTKVVSVLVFITPTTKTELQTKLLTGFSMIALPNLLWVQEIAPKVRLLTKIQKRMTNKRFLQIQNLRSYTIMAYQPNIPDTLRISKDRMVVFNGKILS